MGQILGQFCINVTDLERSISFWSSSRNFACSRSVPPSRKAKACIQPEGLSLGGALSASASGTTGCSRRRRPSWMA